MSKGIKVLPLIVVGLLAMGMGTQHILKPNALAGYSIVSFQVPGQTQITVTDIDNAGDVVGNWVNASSQTIGFERTANGNITNIVDPNSDYGYDRASGINNHGVISGDYAYTVGNSYTYSGYTYQNGTFTNYQVDGEDTSIFLINDSNSFTGLYYDGSAFSGFVNVGGNVTQINEPGATLTYPYGINNAGIIVGEWFDSNYLQHGFAAKTNGSIIGSITYPGAAQTIPNGINNHNEVAGYFIDNSGNIHGFILNKGSYKEANVPNAAQTILLNVNDNGEFCGTYVVPSGAQYGFIATPK